MCGLGVGGAQALAHLVVGVGGDAAQRVSFLRGIEFVVVLIFPHAATPIHLLDEHVVLVILEGVSAFMGSISW